jgi:hypothetical protein
MSGPQAATAFREWEANARPGAMRLPLVALTANVLEQVSRRSLSGIGYARSRRL